MGWEWVMDRRCFFKWVGNGDGNVHETSHGTIALHDVRLADSIFGVGVVFVEDDARRAKRGNVMDERRNDEGKGKERR